MTVISLKHYFLLYMIFIQKFFLADLNFNDFEIKFRFL